MELFFRGIVTRLRDIFDLEAMGASVASLTTSILVALITLAGFLLLWRIIRMVTLAVLDRTRVDETNRSFVLALMQFGLFTVAIIQTLSVAGINVAAHIQAPAISAELDPVSRHVPQEFAHCRGRHIQLG